MGKSILVLLFSLLVISGFAQHSLCRTKFDSAEAILRRTSSFAAQINGEKLVSYNAMVKGLQAETGKQTTDFECFSLIARLFDPIRDNHLAFYQRESERLDPKDYHNHQKVAAFFSLPRLAGFPRVGLNTDSLEVQLRNRPTDSVEGIFYIDDLMRVGLYRTAKPDSLMAVVLDTKIPVWKKGEVVMVLKEFMSGHFRGLVAQPLTKEWSMVRNEKFISSMLVESNPWGVNGAAKWTKTPGARDFREIPPGQRLFRLKNIDTLTQYLRLGTFATHTDILEQSQQFYDSIRTLLTAKRLILDLRNNGGGGFKNSRKFLNLLEPYARTKKIYILVNNRTMSNAEQFLVLLKKSTNVIILGEPTSGAVTYGANQDHHQVLPGTNWIVYPTDMKGSPLWLLYEDVGIIPTAMLTNKSDWLLQTMQYMTEE